jgi:hypothetical protein
VALAGCSTRCHRAGESGSATKQGGSAGHRVLEDGQRPATWATGGCPGRGALPVLVIVIDARHPGWCRTPRVAHRAAQPGGGGRGREPRRPRPSGAVPDGRFIDRTTHALPRQGVCTGPDSTKGARGIGVDARTPGVWHQRTYSSRCARCAASGSRSRSAHPTRNTRRSDAVWSRDSPGTGPGARPQPPVDVQRRTTRRSPAAEGKPCTAASTRSSSTSRPTEGNGRPCNHPGRGHVRMFVPRYGTGAG